MESSALESKRNRPVYLKDPPPLKPAVVEDEANARIAFHLRVCHDSLINETDRRAVRRLAEKQIHVKRFFSSPTFPLPKLSLDEICTHPISKLYEEVFVDIQDANRVYLSNPAGVVPFSAHERFYNRDELVSTMRARLSFYSEQSEKVDNQVVYYHRSDVSGCFPAYLNDRHVVSLEELTAALKLQEIFYREHFEKTLVFVSPNGIPLVLWKGQFCSKTHLQRLHLLEIESLLLLIELLSKNSLDFFISENKIPQEILPLFNHAKTYLLSSSILFKNGEQFYRRIFTYLNNRKADLRCYYIKDDADGYSEIKAKRVIRAITHCNNRYYHLFQQKFLADFSHAEMTRPLKTCTVSREVRNKVTVDPDLIENQSNAYFDYCNAVYRRSSRTYIHEAKLLKLNSQLNALGKFSVPFHILLDLLFFSCDSHEGQYITSQNTKGEVEYVNIDFSRVLSNFIAFTRERQVFCPLRSLFLFHPRSFEPMPCELIHLIESWNIDAIIYELIPLRGNPQEFAEEVDRFRMALLSKNSNPQAARDQIGETCFTKIHPQSFDLLINRLKETKKYIEDCTKYQKTAPTPFGLFERLYPDIAVILDIFKRMTPDPSQMINLKFVEDLAIPRSLESIVLWIKQAKMATPQELVVLDQAVANLQKEAASEWNYVQFFSQI